MDNMFLCRWTCSLLVLLAVVFAASANPEADPNTESNYGFRFGQRLTSPGRQEESNEGRFKPLHEQQQGETVEGVFVLEEERPVRSRRTNRHKISLEGQVQQPDSADVASSFSSMVLHHPEQQRNQHTRQFKNIRMKPIKSYSKMRQNFRETVIPNYKQYKTIKQEDPPPSQSSSEFQNQATHVPNDHIVKEVHPEIMQKLLKQQPQTFDESPQKEAEDFDRVPSQPDYSVAQEENTDANYGISKRPIYVPNRVSVQSPSTDSSFNVGYSIGFGNGFSQHPKVGVVDPPVNFRQGKGISHSSSFQSAPVNVHVEGTNSVWKNMGLGVEMSHNLDSESKHNSFTTSSNDQNDYSSGSEIQRPVFFKESFEQSFMSIPTSGRNTFDHNHALQQSNAFDFSNAIDPIKNQPYANEQGSYRENAGFTDSYPRELQFPTYPSFESFYKQAQPTYPESFSKPTQSSPYPDVPQEEYSDAEVPTVVPHASNDERHKSPGFKYESSKFERPFHSYNSLRNTKPGRLVSKPKPIDFYKSVPHNFKQSYNLKPLANSDYNINQDLYGNNHGFREVQMIHQVYDPVPKSSPPVVPAILVPVNSPIPTFPHHVSHLGVPVVSGGYPPYMGQPIGVLGIPEEMEGHQFPREHFDHSGFGDSGPSEVQQLPFTYEKPHFKTIQNQNRFFTKKYRNDQPSDPKYYMQMQNQPHSRLESSSDHRMPLKFKKMHSTEAPEFSTTESKPSTDSTSYSSPLNHPVEYKSATSPLPVTSHPPRLYRGSQPRPYMIVKRM